MKIFVDNDVTLDVLLEREGYWSAVKKIRLLFTVAQVTESIVDLALASDFTDFEYSVQYYVALTQKVDYLITRNKKHYTNVQMAIVTPQEYLAIVK